MAKITKNNTNKTVTLTNNTGSMTMSTDLEKMRAEVETLRLHNTVVVAELAEVARLKMQIQLGNNATVLQTEAEVSNVTSYNETLNTAIDTCKSIIDQNPVLNKTTGTSRQWTPRYAFNIGEQLGMAYQLATGITMTSKVHKDLICKKLKLSPVLLEMLSRGIGSNTYYSKKTGAVVKGNPGDYDVLVKAIMLLMKELEIEIDMSQVSAEALALNFKEAEVYAEKQFKLAEEGAAALTSGTVPTM